MSGTGTILDPWDIATGLTSGSIAAVDTVYLRGGTYNIGSLTATLTNGTVANPIVFRPYPGERPIISGAFNVTGQNMIFRDLEFCYLDWVSRETANSGATPPDIPTTGINHRSPGTRFINCIFHDCRTNMKGVDGNGSEFYGCLSYHNGWIYNVAYEPPYGHALYVQNESAQAVIEDCIFFDNFGVGVHAYSGGDDHVYNIRLTGNTAFRQGSLDTLWGHQHSNLLVGADVGTADLIEFDANMTYDGSIGLKFYGAGLSGLVLTDNYCPDDKNGWYSATEESGNYWGPATGNQVFVRANKYQSDRANVTIYNQAAANSVTVDLTSVTGLAVGDTVNVHNVQDYFVDIQSLVLDAAKHISVDMRAVSHTVATPIMWAAPATTFPDFGCFVVLKA